MASIQETLQHINNVLKEPSPKGPYSNYSCKTVSWDDVQRGTVGGSLSCWGSNITDTRLYAKDGRQLFTVRGENWNERLGRVRADDLALIASEVGGGGGALGLRPVTLRSVLKNISSYAKYVNLNTASLLDERLDDEVSVRFQATFLPVGEGDKQTLQFAPEAYNYNTTDDEDPRNLILLCTTQGLAVQQDGRGAKKLFHHVKNDSASSGFGGVVGRYWLEAESSSHKVGAPQKESKEEKQDALNRGKATSAVIGTKSVGTRFNVLMTIQVPLRQKVEEISASPEFVTVSGQKKLFGLPMKCYSGARSSCRSSSANRRPGTTPTSAARVSRGTLHDSWNGLEVKDPRRHPDEHITATIVMYYTCSGGVPTPEDVRSAIDDLEMLYGDTEVDGRLGDDGPFDFMKSELAVADMNDISTKVATQPPPRPEAPVDFDTFPT